MVNDVSHGADKSGTLNIEFAQIEPTTRCNFTCGFCCGRHMAQEDMPPDVFSSALEKLPGLRHVYLQGEGEGLMHPDFFEMLGALRSRGVEVSLTTNGSFFSARNVRRLLKADVMQIMVSIESADAASFRRIRGGKLEKVITGIRRLIAAKQQNPSGRPAVGFAVSVLRSTQEDWKRIAQLYDELSMDGGMNIQMLQDMDSYARHYNDELRSDQFSEPEGARLLEEINASPQVSRIQNRASSLPGYYVHSQLYDAWDPASRTCPLLERSMFVARDGHVTPCCYIKDGARHGFGQIQSTPASIIAERRDAMRNELKSGQLPVPCEGCWITRRIGATGGLRSSAGTKRRLAVIQ